MFIPCFPFSRLQIHCAFNLFEKTNLNNKYVKINKQQRRTTTKIILNYYIYYIIVIIIYIIQINL